MEMVAELGSKRGRTFIEGQKHSGLQELFIWNQCLQNETPMYIADEDDAQRTDVTHITNWRTGGLVEMHNLVRTRMNGKNTPAAS